MSYLELRGNLLLAQVVTWHLQVFLRDTDERACAYIAGAAPNRWGFTSDGRDLNTLIEPVPPSLSGLFQQMRLNFLNISS